MQLVRVRVQRIESIRDPDGNLGKRIELVEERVVPKFIVQPSTEEAKMIQDMVQALQQQMPVLPQHSQFSLPKLILFLTEEEYEALEIDFDVNQAYDLEMSGKAIRFKKTP
jgi:hypothetical protein